MLAEGTHDIKTKVKCSLNFRKTTAHLHGQNIRCYKQNMQSDLNSLITSQSLQTKVDEFGSECSPTEIRKLDYVTQISTTRYK